MFMGEYWANSLFDIKVDNLSFNLIHFLPPSKENLVYQAHVKEDTGIFQQILLDQSKSKEAKTFMRGILSTFNHIVAAIANDDMSTSYCIDFETGGQNVSLQAQFLCTLTDVQIITGTKIWYGRFNRLGERNMSFDIFTICHQLKVCFALAFNQQDTSSDVSQEQGPVKVFIGIRD